MALPNMKFSNNQSVVLVTGGAGYIGSHTVRHLAERGERVVVLDNLVRGHAAAVSTEAEFIFGEVSDALVLQRVFQTYEVEAVIHFAAFAYVGESVRDPLKYYHNNVAETSTLLRAVEAHECPNFIFSSSCATYGHPQQPKIDESHPQNPVNPYGRSKLMMEQVLRDCESAFGLKIAILRYFNAAGCAMDGTLGEDHDPEPHLIPRILMAAKGEIDEITIFGQDYETPDGTCIRDYVHVEDLAQAHAQALDHLRSEKASIVCNLGTGAGLSVAEVISLVEEVSGKCVPVRMGSRRRGDPARLVANVDLAKRKLGWQAARTDARAIIETAWKWMIGPNAGRYHSA